MRVHINLNEELVDEVDRRVGHRQRSAYIADAVRKQLESERRWEKIRSAYGSISDEGHPWDPDVAKWVHDSRREDPRRVG
ncbi:MAG: CopG family ribbon-helix-helix protein [Actinomycetota bacterium]